MTTTLNTVMSPEIRAMSHDAFVGVFHPNCFPEEKFFTPVHTQMFRLDADLPVVLDMVLDKKEGSEDFRVISAGCSIGAEVDSILALCNKDHRVGKVAMLGLDINPQMVEIAKKGNYFTPSVGSNSHPDVRLALEYFDFRLEPPVPVKGDSFMGNIMAFPVNPKDVREGHDVEFKIHDIREEIEAVEEVDAIFCNNVLYHLRKDEAMKIVRNLAELLKAKGVLSFDFNTVKSDTEGKINIQTSRGWVTVSSEMLGLEFDLQPLRTLRGTEVFIRE